jgi:hypothetical protein
LEQDKEAVFQRAAFGISPEAQELLLSTIPRWKDRESVHPGLTSADWFELYWQPLFDAGLLYQRALRKADRPLFNAFGAHLRRHNVPLSESLVSRQALAG